MVHHIPHLLNIVAPASLANILATSSALRHQIHRHITKISTASGKLDAAKPFSSSWPRLAHLSIQHSGGVREDIAVLANSTELQLQSLTFSHSRLNPLLMATLMQSNFAMLKRLCLARNQLDSSSILHLFTADLPMLQHLDLSGNRLDACAVSHFAQTNWDCLGTLDLSGNQIGYAGICALINVRLPLLNKLQLFNSGLNCRGWSKLLQGKWRRLQCLDISSNPLLGSGLCKAMHVPRWTALQQLYIANCSLNDSFHWSVMGQLTKLNLPHLQVIDLHNNPLEADSLAQLSKCKWPLERLSPGNLRLDTPAFAHLSLSDWPNLRKLDLGYGVIPVSASAIALLAKSCWPLLEWLSLSSSGFRSARVMSELVRGYFPQLKTLLMCRNAFPPEAATHLIKGNWPCLEKLKVSSLQCMNLSWR